MVRSAVRLSWFTIFYNLIEGIVSISLGIQDDSIALAGFGGDSLIEVGSAILVLWRLSGENSKTHLVNKKRELRASLGIGILFCILAVSASVSAVLQLISKSHPVTTVPGIVISLVSLSFMFYLWSSKKKVGAALQSKTILNDAACSLACIKLSFILLIGSGLYWVFPNLWWADSVATLFLVYFIAKEGVEILRAAAKGDSDTCCSC